MTLAAQIANQPGQLRRLPDLGVAIGTDEQNARVLAVTGYELQKQEGRVVRIVQIVDYYDQRPDTRDVLQQRGDRLEQLESRLLRIGGLRSGISRGRGV